MTYLDQVIEAPPNTIERRITGVTSEARSRGYTAPKEATKAARRALKPLKLNESRMKRGRGKAAAIAPADLRTMAEAPRERQPQPTARRRTVYRVPELARLRDQALNSLKLTVAERNEEMSVLNDTYIQVVDDGLKVHVPSVKSRPPRNVPVTYDENHATCPVRCWQAWQEVKLVAGADPDGPAFLSVDQWCQLGRARLSPDTG
ncbi:hypothetical protein [Streptomyces prasinus]|uniref:hypothetical protein n=1 Tax=Streptomyces prasinus TaxID=67345 RepID=UPI002F40BA02